METVLQLLKLDLGISSDSRDTFFNAYIEAARCEIERKGFEIKLDEVEDQILLSDYTAWKYRKRTEDVPLANNLKKRIVDRIVKARSER